MRFGEELGPNRARWGPDERNSRGRGPRPASPAGGRRGGLLGSLLISDSPPPPPPPPPPSPPPSRPGAREGASEESDWRGRGREKVGLVQGCRERSEVESTERSEHLRYKLHLEKGAFSSR
ncbi:hypothetical protein ACJRO7_022356 [Eucalyptus globulus]|uniref:Uncharacterized protein n=1 Tax=Eucalyptus globulus TaxID=34317 RepID=A0ABD3K4W8_EUCGL